MKNISQKGEAMWSRGIQFKNSNKRRQAAKPLEEKNKKRKKRKTMEERQ